MATLVGSSRDYAHIQVLTYTPSADNLIESIYRHASLKAASNRLQIANGRYMYTPTNEYTQEKSRFIRAKFYR
jgi:hypothetical protein